MKLSKHLEGKSRFLTLILRHKPEQAGIQLDSNGWTDVKLLCEALSITREELDLIVETNDKKRFEFNTNNTEIRACQGHSIGSVELELEVAIPPAELYHGTKEESLKSIQKSGLSRMSRNHVHLSVDKETAKKVADRRGGKSVILSIDAMFMRAEGYKFYKSANGVWLTDEVPSKYISVLP
jgi:putative RNA 2'-phosphotransferase